MIALMHSSAEEFLLLLSKWESESTHVLALLSVSPPEGFAAVVRLSGKVSVDRRGAAFSLIPEDHSTLFLCHISYEGMTYSTPQDVDAAALSSMVGDPREIEDIGILRNASGSIVTLLSLKST